MPPRIRITRDDIINTAVDIIRKHDANAINARIIAKELGCSTQPIFSNFSTMNELKCAIINACDDIYNEYSKKEIESGAYPPYKANGMAYIRFAKEEKELFKLLFMRDRSSENVKSNDEEAKPLFELVHSATGLSHDKARLFHLEMWVCVHGIATMIATSYLELDTELISDILTDCFQGLKKRYEEKE